MNEQAERCRYCGNPLLLTKDRKGEIPRKRNKGGYYFARVWCCTTLHCKSSGGIYLLEKDKRWFPGCGPHTRIDRMRRHHHLPKQPQRSQTNAYARQDASDDGRPPA